MSSAVFAPRAVDMMLTAQDRAGEHFYQTGIESMVNGETEKRSGCPTP